MTTTRRIVGGEEEREATRARRRYSGRGPAGAGPRWGEEATVRVAGGAEAAVLYRDVRGPPRSHRVPTRWREALLEL